MLFPLESNFICASLTEGLPVKHHNNHYIQPLVVTEVRRHIL